MKKYQNLFYAAALFFYVDCVAIAGYFAYKNIKTNQEVKKIDEEIKKDAEEILETPDLTTGLEQLQYAVEQDLKDLEAKYNFKS
jgi:hypothetical protein